MKPLHRLFRARAARAGRSARPTSLLLEPLEERFLPSGMHPHYLWHVPQGAAGPGPFSSAYPTGTTPAQIRHAYGFDQIAFNNGSVAADGSGTTIAIVDAYDDPTIAGDLHQFDAQFGLPDPVFTKVNQNGGSVMPVADTSWAYEISLDVEWAHAVAPGAQILLVEADDNSNANLYAAVQYAARQPGVVAVSMSFGGSEFSQETMWDSVFTTPAGHAGVVFIASSGDRGAPASYPAVSPNVLSVGGTTTQMDSAGNVLSESGWSGSGGGTSLYEAQPGYQHGVVTQSAFARANPDVAYDADPQTGFPIYDSFSNPAWSPWSQFGGTSDAAPQWAGLVAIADQGRALAGLGALDGPTQLLPKLYAASAADYSDVTTGYSAGQFYLYAGPGYDLVTGRGTPHADRIVGGLVGQSVTRGPGQPGQTLAVVPYGTDSIVLAVSQTNQLYWFDAASGAFYHLGAGIQSVSATKESSGRVVVFAVTTDQSLYRFDFTFGWQRLAYAGSVAFATAGTDSYGMADAFVLSPTGSPHEYRGSTGWVQGAFGSAGSILSMSALEGDRVVVLASNHQLYEYILQYGWFSLGSPFTAQSVSTIQDAYGNEVILAVGTDQSMWYWTNPGQRWYRLGGPGTIQTVSLGLDAYGLATLLAVTTGGVVEEVDTAGGWQFLQPPGTPVGVAAGGHGDAVVVLADQSVDFYSDYYGGFYQIFGPGFAH